ncbi:MAG: zinc ribbon domain-containing protein [Sedimentisphaerales bacterium]|nr:zinc ribbon domain-containing protein [Sedimentisphaerales bacterium]
MPIFQYRCQKCGHQFEFLDRGTDRPRCPRCQAMDLDRLPSGFAVGRSRRPEATGCEGCRAGHQQVCPGGTCPMAG